MKIGPKEEALRAQRAAEQMTKRQARNADKTVLAPLEMTSARKMASPNQTAAAEPAKQQESNVKTKTPKKTAPKKTAKRKSAPKVAKAKKARAGGKTIKETGPLSPRANLDAEAKKQKAGKVDRSPLAVGTFIVAAGAAGAPMADIEKRFVMDAHPLRAKIFAARHTLGFKIDFDREKKAYVGAYPEPQESAA